MPIINKRKSNKCSSKCGDCSHFKSEKKFEDTCKNLGIIATSKAPNCYKPDLTTFRKTSALPNIEKLGEAIKNFTPRQARIVANILLSHSLLKDLQFYYGQPVFICLGEEYLSHYFKAYVVDVDTKTGYIHLVSQLKKSKTVTSIAFQKESILNQLQFNQKALELANQGKLVRDKKEFEHFRNWPLADKINKKGLVNVSKLIRLDLDVNVPTIDNAPKDTLEKVKKIKDLSEIFSEVSTGIKITKLKTDKKVKNK